MKVPRGAGGALRFVDSNVFLHALLRPRLELTGEELRVKESAKGIIEGI